MLATTATATLLSQGGVSFCETGHYCPHDAVPSPQLPCGDPKFICPLGSAFPTVVPPGYYSLPSPNTTEQTRYQMSLCSFGYYCPGDGLQHACPPGTFSDTLGASTSLCSGLCEAGYYCTGNSPNKRQYPCGNSSFYCVAGSSKPRKIRSGFYGMHTGVAASADARWDHENKTFSAEIVCDKGYWCENGIKQPCGPGFYGGRLGLNTSTCSGSCSPGFYCPSTTSSRHYPLAPPDTIWPKQPQIIANPYKCGKVSLYCPRNSPVPLIVSPGFYTIGGSKDNTTRIDQVKCPVGSYCQGGIRILCPRGTFGNTEGLSLLTCSGRCPIGKVCPPGTAEPFSCPDNNTTSFGDSYACTPLV